jgi:hypothetical protein
MSVDSGDFGGISNFGFVLRMNITNNSLSRSNEKFQYESDVADSDVMFNFGLLPDNLYR